MEEEIWKDIPGYEGAYQASSYGRIKSLELRTGHGTNAPIKRDLILKNAFTKTGRKGYKTVHLHFKGKGKTFLVHRLIALTFLGPSPDGYTVDHIDENKLNNNINNLRYLSQKDNASRSTKGRFRKKKGNKMENNPRAKQVIGAKNGTIVKTYPCAKYISNTYGINYSTLRKGLQAGGITIQNILFRYETACR